MAEFWGLTLREIGWVLSGHAKARAHALDIAYYQAWHSGLFSQPFKPGKFPDYQKYAPKQRDSQAQTVKHRVMMIKTLHRAFGGTLKVGGRVVE